jgi:hypothetical protein
MAEARASELEEAVVELGSVPKQLRPGVPLPAPTLRKCASEVTQFIPEGNFE